jgi:hypothetical protein
LIWHKKCLIGNDEEVPRDNAADAAGENKYEGAGI